MVWVVWVALGVGLGVGLMLRALWVLGPPQVLDVELGVRRMHYRSRGLSRFRRPTGLAN